MNLINEIRKEVQTLLDSNISAYQIEKATNVSRAKIGRLRNKKNKVDDLSLATIEKLYNYQMGVEEDES
ncbi:helix-turn-helix transcriptional regulator [Staphylococcus americanisciuri]|uniref:Helix-turn-helix transcriptional regulator n=1 Tax=Staphylococcus americanisciuri TaxID=2973940 RepID=A0ABT2F1V6_9STAP|nr:helix-turn-helix transcriptional regulator [Staphylococcus americanisciuri]MCS4486397.1 helix-turn-helix transcriptional regulator [Staphylococcus americanisciuri]